jgi:hypothetical protein
VRIRESSYLHDLCTFIRPFPVTRLLVIPHNAQQIVIPPFAFMTFRCPLPLKSFQNFGEGYGHGATSWTYLHLQGASFKIPDQKTLIGERFVASASHAEST